MRLQFFFPEFILHKYSVEGYMRRKARAQMSCQFGHVADPYTTLGPPTGAVPFEQRRTDHNIERDYAHKSRTKQAGDGPQPIVKACCRRETSARHIAGTNSVTEISSRRQEVSWPRSVREH